MLVRYYALATVLVVLCAARTSAQIGPDGKIMISKPQEPPKKSDSKSIGALTFERMNLGSNVNSEYSELFPIISPDEQILFFTRKGAPENVGYAKNKDDEDIWFCTKQRDNTWSKAQHLDGPLNTDQYDGVRAINSTATRLYLQNVYRADGTRGKGFSVSEKMPDGSWSYPEGLDIEDYYNDTSVSMMTISNDEKTIVLALKRKDGIGKHDLYVSHNLGGLHWSRPELIAALSTPGDELSPYIAFDDHNLYFSTDGLGGYGMHDIFITRRLDSTWQKWTTPRNLGQPINTPSFDAYFIVNGSGDSAYFSSSHETSSRGYGKSDIWRLELKEDQRPGFRLPQGADYADKVKEEDLEGQAFRMDEVHFDVGRSTIKGESMAALDKVAVILNKFPHIRIEVQGHTDSDGDAGSNLRLSQERADAVRAYLTNHGVSPGRVAARGYGETQPIAPNTTAHGKALNRRVMLIVQQNAGS
jgi:outer membrane protein OmpA-like peptidoglycan-associated protein